MKIDTMQAINYAIVMITVAMSSMVLHGFARHKTPSWKDAIDKPRSRIL